MTLLVVGSLHLDVVTRAPHLPGIDETVTGSGVDYVFGGKGGNQAIAAARMGGQVHFAGRAGSDTFGHSLRHTLAAAGVNTQQLQPDPGPSGMSVAIVNADGDYGAVIVSAANLNIDADAIRIPNGTKLVLLQNEIPDAVNAAVARKARASGVPVWLNAAPARTLSSSLVASCDLLLVNRVEAAFYKDLSGGPEVLKTLGAGGVRFRGRTYPAPEVRPVSSHGAGDMFAGALAASVASGQTPQEAIGFAQAAAALHVASDLAARAAMTRDQVTAFLNAQPSR
ncbi:PfkB family carbohydrate kinase [Roseobacter sp.]|uniref:PfkB family carbohydrate kinase n=1 Tax=Roseobacter sp. TaxID=1907202 RepID=UPI0025F573CC|nr:PfkB family carbohydrate kinase [Roseobacter sp.]